MYALAYAAVTDEYTLIEQSFAEEQAESDDDGFAEEYEKAKLFDCGELVAGRMPVAGTTGARVAVAPDAALQGTASCATAAGPPEPAENAPVEEVKVLLVGDQPMTEYLSADDPLLSSSGFETCIVPNMIGVPL